MNKKSKIYITGSSGMVGKTLTNKLKDEGFENIITTTSKELNLKNQYKVNKFFKEKKPEYIFHLAAKVGGIGANIKSPAEFLNDNLQINSNVINAAHKNKTKKLLYLGSSCIYPKECKQPMKEEYLLSGKLEPTNEGYSIAKIAGLKLCEFYSKQYGDNFISLMPPNLYGINEKFDSKNSHVVASLIKKFHKAKINNEKEVIVWGTGKARREFLYVNDIIDAMIYFMKYENSKDLAPFTNIGSNTDISIYDLAKLIKKITKFKGNIELDKTKPDGMPKKLLDTSKANDLGWKSKTTLEEGLKKTYKWFLELEQTRK